MRQTIRLQWTGPRRRVLVKLKVGSARRVPAIERGPLYTSAPCTPLTSHLLSGGRALARRVMATLEISIAGRAEASFGRRVTQQ